MDPSRGLEPGLKSVMNSDAEKGYGKVPPKGTATKGTWSLIPLFIKQLATLQDCLSDKTSSQLLIAVQSFPM
ncbi:hypothetical protein Peur_025593 [Populus x canadensis]